jgi:hypothetical protein
VQIKTPRDRSRDVVTGLFALCERQPKIKASRFSMSLDKGRLFSCGDRRGTGARSIQQSDWLDAVGVGAAQEAGRAPGRRLLRRLDHEPCRRPAQGGPGMFD